MEFTEAEVKKITGSPWKVDVPVCIFIWIRPELQRKQFEIVKKARPREIFLISDGGRNKKEWHAVRKNRKMYETEIDWDCTLHKVYHKKNVGMYANGNIAWKYVWEHADRSIFLEDDIIPSVSFFSFCAEMLERYKNDERIYWVNGLNYQETSRVTDSYFFSSVGSIWGFATWKRIYEAQYNDFAYAKDRYIMNLLKNVKKSDKQYYRQMLAYPHNRSYGGHPPGAEFFFGSCPYLQHQLNIVPAKNMIQNAGCRNSAHSDDIRLMPKGIRKIFLLQSYEMDIPISHPKYVIPDTGYEKYVKRLNAVNHPAVGLYRKYERAMLLFMSGNSARLLDKVKQNAARKRNVLIEK